ncbi:MAG: hypothetical protein AAGF07_01650 [Patescibacteria group bacterium]
MNFESNKNLSKQVATTVKNLFESPATIINPYSAVSLSSKSNKINDDSIEFKYKVENGNIQETYYISLVLGAKKNLDTSYLSLHYEKTETQEVDETKAFGFRPKYPGDKPYTEKNTHVKDDQRDQILTDFVKEIQQTGICVYHVSRLMDLPEELNSEIDKLDQVQKDSWSCLRGWKELSYESKSSILNKSLTEFNGSSQQSSSNVVKQVISEVNEKITQLCRPLGENDLKVKNYPFLKKEVLKNMTDLKTWLTNLNVKIDNNEVEPKNLINGIKELSKGLESEGIAISLAKIDLALDADDLFYDQRYDDLVEAMLKIKHSEVENTPDTDIEKNFRAIAKEILDSVLHSNYTQITITDIAEALSIPKLELENSLSMHIEEIIQGTSPASIQESHGSNDKTDLLETYIHELLTKIDQKVLEICKINRNLTHSPFNCMTNWAEGKNFSYGKFVVREHRYPYGTAKHEPEISISVIDPQSIFVDLGYSIDTTTDASNPRVELEFTELTASGQKIKQRKVFSLKDLEYSKLT